MVELLRNLFFRFICGLNTLGLVDEMKRGDHFKNYFLHCENLTAQTMLAKVFSTVEFSLQGSSLLMKEESIASFWRDFVVDCEGNLLHFIMLED